MSARRGGKGWAVRPAACALIAVLAAGPATVAAAPNRPRGPLAPPLRSERWINSRPLAQADLRGKVLLVEFWTFDCINCIRTVPAMRQLRASLPVSEVVIVGVHTPELDRERELRNVERAVARLGVTYPVALDNDYAIWRSFNNRYWPALYVVDKRGVIRHVHTGELHQRTSDWDEVTSLVESLRKESP